MDVFDYCLARAGARFAPSRSDCATFAAGWAIAGLGVNGRVPRVSRRRGRQASTDAARLVRLARRWARKAGLVEITGAARAGDIGILDGECGAAFGLCTGASWAVLAPVGFGYVVAEPHVVFGVR